MYVSRDVLLQQLPDYKDGWVMVHPNQEVRDIIVTMLDSYEEFARYYDKIALYFDADTVEEICDNLYNFCKKNIAYVEETEDSQTVALPTGILTRGIADCKGYAGFIGGCLGAITRLTGKKINWEFCFASYRLGQRVPHHVFVIVHDRGTDIWVDPTPGSSGKQPVWMLNKKPPKIMALYKNISGIGEGDTGSDHHGHNGVGAVSDVWNDALDQLQSTGNGSIDLAAIDPTGGVAAGIVSSLQGIVGPNSEVGKWLGDLSHPAQLITDVLKAIKGYKYTGGDYALAEIMQNRVQGKATTSRWQVPDELVPLAWTYFTTLFGVPIAVNTDLDHLLSGDAAAYMAGRPERARDVTPAMIDRAIRLINLPAMRPVTQTTPQWGISSFTLLPYVAPIPDPRVPGKLFSGMLPNGQQIVNGVPATAALKGGNVQVPGGAAGTGLFSSTGGKLLLGVGILGAVWYLSGKKLF